MNLLSRELQTGAELPPEDSYVIRRVSIPIVLAIAVGLGYLALVAPEPPGTVLIDIAFVTSVISFLVLLVSVLGDQIKRTSD